MATVCDIQGKKAEISYPLYWKYKVILEKQNGNFIKIDEILDGYKYQISQSKKSSGEKYESYNVSVFVADDSERLAVFEILKKHAKFVL